MPHPESLANGSLHEIIGTARKSCERAQLPRSVAGIDGSAGLNEASRSHSVDQRSRWLSRLTCTMLQT